MECSWKTFGASLWCPRIPFEDPVRGLNRQWRAALVTIIRAEVLVIACWWHTADVQSELVVLQAFKLSNYLIFLSRNVVENEFKISRGVKLVWYTLCKSLVFNWAAVPIGHFYSFVIQVTKHQIICLLESPSACRFQQQIYWWSYQIWWLYQLNMNDDYAHQLTKFWFRNDGNLFILITILN